MDDKADNRKELYRRNMVQQNKLTMKKNWAYNYFQKSQLSHYSCKNTTTLNRFGNSVIDVKFLDTVSSNDMYDHNNHGCKLKSPQIYQTTNLLHTQVTDQLNK